MRKRYIAFVFGLVALIAFFALENMTPAKRSSNQATSSEPEFVVSGISAEYFSDSGVLRQQIDAESATHVADSKDTLFIRPSMILRQGEQADWGIRADEGVLKDEKLLTLTGNVQVVPLSEHQPAYTMSTPTLVVDLRQEIAETQDKVLIEGPGTELVATGMRLLLKEEQATFLSEVRARHDPNTQ